MKSHARTLIPSAGFVPPVRVLSRDLRCASCNYGIALFEAGIRCPMCGGAQWVSHIETLVSAPTRDSHGF